MMLFFEYLNTGQSLSHEKFKHRSPARRHMREFLYEACLMNHGGCFSSARDAKRMHARKSARKCEGSRLKSLFVNIPKRSVPYDRTRPFRLKNQTRKRAAANITDEIKRKNAGDRLLAKSSRPATRVTHNNIYGI